MPLKFILTFFTSADILIKVFIEMILEKSSTKHIWENLYPKRVLLSGILLMVAVIFIAYVFGALVFHWHGN